MTEKETPRPRIIESKNPIKICEPGILVKSKVDLYITPDKWGLDNSNQDDYNGMGGNTLFFSQESNLMILETAQFNMNDHEHIRVNLLKGDQSGWSTVYVSSVFKEWRWLIPLKRAKLVKDVFDSMFSPLTVES